MTAKWLRWTQAEQVQVQTHWYDVVGRPWQVQDARGNQKTFGYDAEGRLNAIQYTVNAANTQPTPDVAVTYEPVYGRLATVADGTGVTSYSYVPMNPADGMFGDGALAAESKTVGGAVQFTHAYSYDELGRTLTGPRQDFAQWDDLGRLTNIASGLGAFTFGYQGNSGRLAQVDAALTDATVAFSTGFTYDGAAQGRRLTGIVHQVGFAPTDWRVLSQHNYGYDTLGRLSTWQKSWRDWATAVQTSTWALTHDADDQLAAVAETDATAAPTGSFAYGYDLAGNRITADRTTLATGTVNRQWTPNGLNQLAAQTAGPEAGAYIYDADGNLLSEFRAPSSAFSYQWDAENRLVGVTGPFGTVTWEYDAFSRRVKQHNTAPASPEVVRDLIWDGLSIIESRDQTTGEIRRYYGNGEERELAATVTSVQSYYYFDGSSQRRPSTGFDWWVYDATTDEYATPNTTDLVNWICPLQPANVTATQTGVTSVELRWQLGFNTRNDLLGGGFRIERWESGPGGYQPLTSGNASDFLEVQPDGSLLFRYQDSLPMAGTATTYAYRVIYYYGGRESAPAQSPNVTDWIATLPFANVTAKQTGVSNVELGWSLGVSPINGFLGGGFRIERSDNGPWGSYRALRKCWHLNRGIAGILHLKEGLNQPALLLDRAHDV